MQKNDYVVCIHNDETDLILNKIYQIKDVRYDRIVIELNGHEFGFYPYRFKLLDEIRRDKINKIKNRCK